ncbi:Hypothetical protein (Fragment), partial [Durusdinium trenchii]
VDLAREALQSGRHGVTLLVDLLDFCAWFLPEVDHAAKGWTDNTLTVYGGEFPQHDDALCEAIFGLRHAGIYLEFFMDPPRGHGLVDSATNSWIDEGKRRCNQGLDVAKAVRLWCRGERNDLPNLVEARSLPPLFYEQVVATLARCGCQVWHLSAHEQSPLLSTRRGSDWAHVWGIVSDNIDWAVVPGMKLIPLSFFDLHGVLKPKDAESPQWPEVESFLVAYTSADLVAEHLRLGHPPKEEEVKDGHRQGEGWKLRSPELALQVVVRISLAGALAAHWH